ncbi:helix-turn-helix transcriptional regulator, partial [Pseudomonas aeruginosa]|nr:helix-turn-helix transcriptional regulator [Pseudomonas aeruginosa]
MTEPLPSSSLGPALRRWRLLHRVKQTHAAELLGEAQSTISRWESGTQALLVEERARLERLLGARLEAAADQAL